MSHAPGPHRLDQSDPDSALRVVIGAALWTASEGVLLFMSCHAYLLHGLNRRICIRPGDRAPAVAGDPARANARNRNPVPRESLGYAPGVAAVRACALIRLDSPHLVQHSSLLQPQGALGDAHLRVAGYDLLHSSRPRSVLTAALTSAGAPHNVTLSYCAC